MAVLSVAGIPSTCGAPKKLGSCPDVNNTSLAKVLSKSCVHVKYIIAKKEIFVTYFFWDSRTLSIQKRPD